jgi:penicillin-binding protein 2
VSRKHSFVPVVVHEDLTWEQMSRIEVSTPEPPGVSIERSQQRSYPFQATLSHVVGYVGAVSEAELGAADPVLELSDFRTGKSGVEKAYDRELRGRAGTLAVEVNAFGRVVRELSREESIAGQDIVLSLSRYRAAGVRRGTLRRGKERRRRGPRRLDGGGIGARLYPRL